MKSKRTIEDAQSAEACNVHENCNGPLCVSPANGAYLIRYGFALGGEIVSSDGSLINQAVIDGNKAMIDIANHCYNKIGTKSGILRKSCNGYRPRNSFRLVASPSTSSPRTIEIPPRVMNRAVFLALPMKVMAADENVNSVRIPLKLYGLNNAASDGDELWLFVPMTRNGMSEVNKHWIELWNKTTVGSVFRDVSRIVSQSGIAPEIDPAMLTTMTFEEMSTHEGWDMYDSMMLMPSSWRQMYATLRFSKALHWSEVG
ncbi:MAG: hypothetical protein M1831_003821 [Alyxoria varia]|nr:MAG: hypothetical protein M1831_003821 [Alyxoria varia]